MAYRLSRRSIGNLEGVHPDMVKVVLRAIEITEVDFGVLEGARSIERQKELLEAKATKTMNSRHLPRKDKKYCLVEDGGLSHAVDLGAYIGADLRWDWPLYRKIALAMKQAAKELGVVLQWGGDWRRFKDGPHFQLSWTCYL